MTIWEEIACRVEDEYGAFVDWNERFFICPECGEPIYEDDWRDSDFTFGASFNGVWYCPVCKEVICEE